MIQANIWSKEQEVELHIKINKEIEVAWLRAMNDPYPSSDVTLKYVYE
jgi:TPP-dependent pyruvate/acetoin dehydrogenase alpha subunit